MSKLYDWLKAHHITEVECLVADATGIARGKILPRSKFSNDDEGMRLPEIVLVQTVNGDYPDEMITDPTDTDMVLQPDPDTVRLVPWANDPTAQVIHDCFHFDGRPCQLSPRYVLRRVVELYEKQGWQPVIAPEVEFYLVDINKNPEQPLRPPIGRTGRSETGRQAYSIDAVNEFDPLFEDIYDYCDVQGLEIDTLIHEIGSAQMEINFRHGDPLTLADTVFLFKRTVREAAIRHNMYATFMAKPMEDEPGSALHLHQSVRAQHTGENVFTLADGSPSDLFFSFIAGMQTYLPAAMPFFAPFVNSYRRLAKYSAAPINVQWGYDNRTVGLRVPHASPDNRRVENRVPGVDSNPYLAIAASLACGYLGMMQGLQPTEPLQTSAYDLPYALPRNLDDALGQLRNCKPLAEVIGERFVRGYCAVKEKEYSTYHRVISSWERKHLLLHV